MEEIVNIRILANDSNSRLLPFKIYDIRNYSDLSPTAVQDTIKKGAWHEIVFDNPLLIPKKLKKVLIVIDLMEESSYFNISTQNYRKSSIETAFFSPPYKLWIFKGSKQAEFAAMELELLVEWKEDKK